MALRLTLNISGIARSSPPTILLSVPSQSQTVGDFVRYAQGRLSLPPDETFSLYLNKALIPADELINVFRDNDTVTLKRAMCGSVPLKESATGARKLVVDATTKTPEGDDAAQTKKNRRGKRGGKRHRKAAKSATTILKENQSQVSKDNKRGRDGHDMPPAGHSSKRAKTVQPKPQIQAPAQGPFRGKVLRPAAGGDGRAWIDLTLPFKPLAQACSSSSSSSTATVPLPSAGDVVRYTTLELDEANFTPILSPPAHGCVIAIHGSSVTLKLVAVDAGAGGSLLGQVTSETVVLDWTSVVEASTLDKPASSDAGVAPALRSSVVDFDASALDTASEQNTSGASDYREWHATSPPPAADRIEGGSGGNDERDAVRAASASGQSSSGIDSAAAAPLDGVPLNDSAADAAMASGVPSNNGAFPAQAAAAMPAPAPATAAFDAAREERFDRRKRSSAKMMGVGSLMRMMMAPLQPKPAT